MYVFAVSLFASCLCATARASDGARTALGQSTEHEFMVETLAAAEVAWWPHPSWSPACCMSSLSRQLS